MKQNASKVEDLKSIRVVTMKETTPCVKSVAMLRQNTMHITDKWSWYLVKQWIYMIFAMCVGSFPFAYVTYFMLDNCDDYGTSITSTVIIFILILIMYLAFMCSFVCVFWPHRRPLYDTTPTSFRNRMMKFDDLKMNITRK